MASASNRTASPEVEPTRQASAGFDGHFQFSTLAAFFPTATRGTVKPAVRRATGR